MQAVGSAATEYSLADWEASISTDVRRLNAPVVRPHAHKRAAARPGPAQPRVGAPCIPPRGTRGGSRREAAATIADSVLSNALSLPAGAMLVVALFASSVLMVRRAVDAGFKRELELLGDSASN